MADVATIDRLRGLEPFLRTRIRGQDHLLPRIASGFCRAGLSLTAPDRPRASFLFVGPTGVGKSETFRLACDHVFGAGRLVTFDMSEYQDRSAVNKLLGEDRSDPGLLGRALRVAPPGGVLFDEVEKAHPLVLDVFLQILWGGRVTVATGEVISFGDKIVGFTSNIGAVESMRMERVRFASVEQATLRRVEQSLRPELVGRIDEKLVFARLGHDVQREICGLEVARETARLRALGHDLAVSAGAMEFLLREGFHPQLGARPLRKTVERHLQDAVVSSLFARGFASGRVEVDMEQRQLQIALH